MNKNVQTAIFVNILIRAFSSFIMNPTIKKSFAPIIQNPYTNVLTNNFVHLRIMKKKFKLTLFTIMLKIKIFICSTIKLNGVL